MNFNRFKYVLLIFCISLSFAGCSYVPSLSENDSESIWTDSGAITIGNHLTIQNRDNRLTLLNNIDTLSADGLYYASWCIGDSKPMKTATAILLIYTMPSFTFCSANFPAAMIPECHESMACRRKNQLRNS